MVDNSLTGGPLLSFRRRERIREVTRRKWIACNGNPIATQDAAELEMRGLVTVLLFSVVSALISALIRNWLASGVAIPPLTYQSGDPGYEPHFEDDES